MKPGSLVECIESADWVEVTLYSFRTTSGPAKGDVCVVTEVLPGIGGNTFLVLQEWPPDQCFIARCFRELQPPTEIPESLFNTIPDEQVLELVEG